jgi:hypothetical protein
MSKPVNMACLVLAFLFLKILNVAADIDIMSSLSHELAHLIKHFIERYACYRKDCWLYLI